MNAKRAQRKQRAVAARLLLSLHASDKLEDPQRWTWDAVSRLPPWCLASTDDRQCLQLMCGALILSPEIRYWIRKPLLLGLKQVLGVYAFAKIFEQADSMQLPREPLAEFLEQANFDAEQAGALEVELLLMQCGATVLAATLHESLPREMLSESLGPAIGSIDDSAANAIVEVAAVMLSEHQTSEHQTSETG